MAYSLDQRYHVLREPHASLDNQREEEELQAGDLLLTGTYRG